MTEKSLKTLCRQLGTMYHQLRTKTKGFTLIELLVVIAILGILISIVSVNLVTAQKQARDARRMLDLEKIQTSLESYFAEYQEYPTTYTDAFEGGIAPKDPKPSGSYNWTNLSTTAYCICVLLETTTGNAAVPTTTTCSWDAAGTYFCIQNKQ